MMLPRVALSTLLLAGGALTVPQDAMAQCSQCAEKSNCNNCCRPNYTKIVIWKSNLTSGGLSPFVGGAPPQGFAVGSVPALMVSQPALAVAPASFVTANVAPAGLTQADIDAVRRFSAASAAANTTSAASGNTCPDPCGDILQLKRDVRDLTSAIEKITTKLESIDQQLKK